MAEQSNALSVSAAMAIAKRQLEDITVRVVGEVSEFSANPRYKAVYFTVKDEHASLPCMMWNNRYQSLGMQLQVGALVEMTGRFTLYAAKGRMSFDVFSIELAGEGRLRMQVANLAKRLEAEGLMEAARKRQIPRFPQTIGLVTSPRGAAVYDVMRTLRRRFPLARIVFAGVGVEGAKAPKDMAEGLSAVRDAGAEVILLVRGGGSFEDLMPFNDEGLARLIAGFEVPIVTGIGHEPDTSIADMVSDLRASTPTAAAEAIAPSSQEVRSALDAYGARMSRILESRLSSTRARLEKSAALPVFSEPTRLFESQMRQLDDMTAKLHGAIPGYFSSSGEKLSKCRVELKLGLASLLAPYISDIKQERASLLARGKSLVSDEKRLLSMQAASLDALSPLAVLGRGYAIARLPDGTVVKHVSQVSAKEKISVQVSDGAIECEVERTIADEGQIGEADA